jgi:hypothetical protein
VWFSEGVDADFIALTEVELAPSFAPSAHARGSRLDCYCELLSFYTLPQK